jgi:hypothetical protein
MKAIKNFELAAKALINEAPTDNARIFVESLTAKIRAKGTNWIVANVCNLHITDAEVSGLSLAPVGHNRWLLYLERWQHALEK